MIGRFLLGALTGGILVTAGMVVASALFPLGAPQPDLTDADPAELAATDPVDAPVDAPDETPVADEADEATADPTEDVAEAAPEPEPAPAETVTETAAVAAVPEAVEPAADATEPAADPAVEPSEGEAGETAAEVTPEAAVPEAASLEQPEVEETAPEAAGIAGLDTDTADATGVAEVEAPAVPEPPEALDPISEEAPAEVAATEVATESAADTAEAAPMEDQAAAPDSTTESAEAAATAEAVATEAGAEAEAGTLPATEPAPEMTAEAETAPEGEAAVDSGTETLPETAAEDAPEPAAEAETQPEAAPEAGAEVAAETDPDQGSTFQSTPGFASDGAITDRDAEAAEAEAAPEATADAALAEDAPPIQRFAASFENPEAKPVLAIVLIDSGAADLDRAALAALPFPVSFALDPMDPATPERAAIYRAAGREVVMLATGIAVGAQASDVEVAFQSMISGLPEAVAVMDLAEPVFQNDRPLATLVVPVVGAEGRGLLTWEKGLNAADQVARRDDIPAAVIFRDLATGGGDAAATKRTLDRAVFKAGQDGQTVVAGLVTPELVAGLLEWSVEGRAATVALGPLTAVLKVD